jgi:hypothetical protein
MQKSLPGEQRDGSCWPASIRRQLSLPGGRHDPWVLTTADSDNVQTELPNASLCTSLSPSGWFLLNHATEEWSMQIKSVDVNRLLGRTEQQCHHVLCTIWMCSTYTFSWSISLLVECSFWKFVVFGNSGLELIDCGEKVPEWRLWGTIVPSRLGWWSW